jgi:plasmid maintenance system antidote protein VapI
MRLNEIAKRLDKHPTTVSRWFSGSRSISASTAVLLEKATGIDRRAWLWPDEFENPMLKDRKASGQN